MVKKLIVGLAWAWCVAAAAQPAPGAEAKAVAEKLMALQMEVMRPADMAQRMGEQMKSQVVAALRQQQPGREEAYYDRAAEIVARESNAASQQMLKEALPALQQDMIDMLTGRFTLDELNEMYRYQSSPTGRKAMAVVAQEMPRLMQPLMQRMMQGAPQLGERIGAALKKEGYDLR
jgi:hypothetical protein